MNTEMKGWESFSGTGEQQQEQALETNLKEIRDGLTSTIRSYQTDGIASKEPVKNILGAAQKFIEEIDTFSKREE